jgi:hypothetical protein
MAATKSVGRQRRIEGLADTITGTIGEDDRRLFILA